MKESALLVGDLHAHAWSRFATIGPDGTNSRVESFFRVLAQITKLIHECEPGVVCLLGDLTHRRHYVEFGVYTRLMAVLEDWARLSRVVALVGNHDIEREGVHALGPLTFLGVHVVSRPVRIDLPGLGHTLCVPYMTSVEPMLTACRATTCDSLLMHYAFDGHRLATAYEYALPSPLRLSDCDGASRIFLGHIHTPAVEQQGRVTYVGAVQHLDFGDDGPRFAWLVSARRSTTFLLQSELFATATFPEIPTCGSPLGGYLRVLQVPPGLHEDVQQQGRSRGWLEVVTIEAGLSTRAVQQFTQQTPLDDEALIRSFVDAEFERESDERRAVIAAVGLDCLREAD